jgi:branched-chain amino acid transport system ATP-binding protein
LASTAERSTPALEQTGVDTFYGESHVLHGVELHVQQGEVVCLLGRNGAGKTTTIRTIAGLTPPRRGTIRLLAEPIQHRPPYEIARHGIGLVPQGRRVFRDLSVAENLLISARGGADGGWSIERVYDLFPVLAERKAQKAGFLSGGEQQMLAIARALVGNPRLLLMDEPSEGLAPRILADVRETILELKETGLSILLVEQKLPLALALADRIYVMVKGQIVFEGTPAELDASEDVKSNYLGIGARVRY